MSFTTPCFIRNNTKKLRDKIYALGNRNGTSLWGDEFNTLIAVSNDSFRCWDDEWGNADRLVKGGYIDCGTNTDLFLAIAALRDDSDYMQWFIEDITNPYGVGGQICGLEPRRKIGEKWICQTEKKSGESMRISNSIKEDIENSYNGTSNYRKATVSELITYFKNNEQ